VAAAGDGRWFVNTADGQVDLVELPRFADPTAAAQAGSLSSPMPGSVVRVLAEAGSAVTAGQPLLVLEAMKMEHEIVAPVDGVSASCGWPRERRSRRGPCWRLSTSPDSFAP
jgi:propionyl-CoA carboxylase alpha chain